MTPQEKELYVLLKYASKKMSGVRYYCKQRVSEPRPYEFYTEGVLSINSPAWKVRDCKSVTLNFKKKTVKWWAAYESSHNGADYSTVDGNEQWDSYLPNAYEELLPIVKEHLREEIKFEENRKIEEMYKAKAEKRLEEMLDEGMANE